MNIEVEINNIFKSYPPELENYYKLRNRITNFFMGQVMKREPNANPYIIRKLIVEKLEGL